MMSTLISVEKYREKLQLQLPLIRNKYLIESLGIFGSYVNGKETPESDLDILITFSETPSLLRFIELENLLSDSLGVKIDLVMKESLKPRLAQNILREVIPI